MSTKKSTTRKLHSFPEVLPLDQPPAIADTPRATDGLRTPPYILGWMVPTNHLWSLKFNGRERHYNGSTFMQSVILPLFKAVFPHADNYPRGLAGMGGDEVIYLAMNTPTRVWIEEQQDAIVQFVMETLKLPNPPMWYRAPWMDTMLPLYKKVWPNAYEIEYEEGSDSESVDFVGPEPDSESESSEHRIETPAIPSSV